MRNNNRLIAAEEVESDQGAFADKIPSSFDEVRDIYALPVKTNGDRFIALGDLAEIRLTFEDRTGTARFNAEHTVALQMVKRKGFNLIKTGQVSNQLDKKEQSQWHDDLQVAVKMGTSNAQSRMVRQLEGSVLTAIALVMMVVLS